MDQRVPSADEDLFMIGAAAGIPNSVYRVWAVQDKFVPLKLFNDTGGKPLFDNPPDIDVLQVNGIVLGGISGGPVVDRRGAALGVASGSLFEGGSYGWAIPAREVAGLLSVSPRHDKPTDIARWPPIPLISTKLRSTEYFVRRDESALNSLQDFTRTVNIMDALNQKIFLDSSMVGREFVAYSSAINVSLAGRNIYGTGPVTVSDLNYFINQSLNALSFPRYRQTAAGLRQTLSKRYRTDGEIRSLLSRLSEAANRSGIDSDAAEHLQQEIVQVVQSDPEISTNTYEGIRGIDTGALIEALDRVTARTNLQFTTLSEASNYRDDLQFCVDQLGRYQLNFINWEFKEKTYFAKAAELLRKYWGVMVYVPE